LPQNCHDHLIVLLPSARARTSGRDRPALSTYLDLLSGREAKALAVDSPDDDLEADAPGFLMVPLETIGKRIDANADVSLNVLTYCEERVKHLQRTLEKMRKRSPAVPLGREFKMGTLEAAISELNRIHESECIQIHGRSSALEIRVRQPLAMARENAVGCGVDYEAELHRAEREVAKARDKLTRSKAAELRAAERLMTARTRASSDTPGSAGLLPGAPAGGYAGGLLSAVRSRQASNQIEDARVEETDAEEALEQAIKQVADDCRAVLVAVRRQDRVAAGVAVAFEACDRRIRDATAASLKVLVDIEVEAAAKRQEDLSRLAVTLEAISSSADGKNFIAQTKRPDLVHASGAALSLLHDPSNRGALVGAPATPPSHAPPSHGSTSLLGATRNTRAGSAGGGGESGADDGDGEGIGAALAGDRVRTDMERVVIALFSAGQTPTRPAQITKWSVGSPRDGQPPPSPLIAAEAAESGASAAASPATPAAAAPVADLVVDPLLHPLSVLGPASPARYEAPAITGNEKRRLLAMLDEEVGREAFVHALNQQRSRRTEIGDAGFAELAAATAKVLDKCQQSHDVHTAKMAMMLSQTFYREVEVPAQGIATLGAPGSTPSRDTREYLKNADVLVAHPLWRDMKFWDEACWQSIAESLKEGQGSGHGEVWHGLGPLETRDAVLRVHNIVFSQVGAYAHSMVEFGCPPALAKQFVRRLAATYQLGEDQKDMLLALARG